MTRTLLLGFAALVAASTAAVPAKADRWDHGRGYGYGYGHEWRGGDRDWRYRRGYYRPGYYVPPPVYYVPPLRPYYPPPVIYAPYR